MVKFLETSLLAAFTLLSFLHAFSQYHERFLQMRFRGISLNDSFDSLLQYTGSKLQFTCSIENKLTWNHNNTQKITMSCIIYVGYYDLIIIFMIDLYLVICKTSVNRNSHIMAFFESCSYRSVSPLTNFKQNAIVLKKYILIIHSLSENSILDTFETFLDYLKT